MHKRSKQPAQPQAVYSDRLDHSFRCHSINDTAHSITVRSAATVWVDGQAVVWVSGFGVFMPFWRRMEGPRSART